MPLTL
ncbi:hypothetical protein Patl1_20713 [Pistacia atlantica]